MNLQRTLAISRKVLRSLRHDRRTAGFLVLMPLLMIIIFGYTFGGEVKGINIVVVNLDHGTENGSLAESIIADLSSRDVLKITELVTSDDNITDPMAYAWDRVSTDSIWAAVIFPEDFSAKAEAAKVNISKGLPSVPSQIVLFTDGSNINVVQGVLMDVQGAVQRVSLQEFHVLSPMVLSEERVYGQNATFIDSFAPGVMALAVMMVTFMLSIISFVQERKNGTLDRLLTTPLKEEEIVCGYALGFGLVALIQASVVLSAAVLLFGVHIEGNVLLLLLLLILLGLGMQGLGLLLSSNAKNEFQALQFMPIILFPSILLAGVFWPLEAVPDFLRPISYFIPLTYAVEGSRSVMIRGWGIESIWMEVLVLAVFATIMLVLSAMSLRRRD